VKLGLKVGPPGIFRACEDYTPFTKFHTPIFENSSYDKFQKDIYIICQKKLRSRRLQSLIMGLIERFHFEFFAMTGQVVFNGEFHRILDGLFDVSRGVTQLHDRFLIGKLIIGIQDDNRIMGE